MIVAVTNQKGAVGEDTTTANLGVVLARCGRRVLLVGTDPQSALTRQLPKMDRIAERTAEPERLAAGQRHDHSCRRGKPPASQPRPLASRRRLE
jgi:cellulose biosynthesis protein BcsQ